MKQWKLLAILGGAALAASPIASANGAGEHAPDRMTPQERKLTADASRAIFATHAAERAEAAGLGLADLGADLRALRREVERLQLAEARAELQSSLSSGRAGAGTDRRAALRRSVDARLSRTALRRAAVETQLAELKSERQRRVVLRGLQKIADLEQEVRDATAAPAGARSRRLAGVKDQLVVERSGASPLPIPGGPSPTFQMVPEDRLPHPAVE